MVIKRLTQVTADYAEGIIHGKDGDVVYTEGGCYEIHEDFPLYGLIMN